MPFIFKIIRLSIYLIYSIFVRASLKSYSLAESVSASLLISASRPIKYPALFETYRLLTLLRCMFLSIN